jgi:hypothetical protein
MQFLIYKGEADGVAIVKGVLSDALYSLPEVG